MVASFVLLGAAQTPSILIHGDSLSAAYGISREESWVSLLEKRLQAESFNYTVVNSSISGETTLGGQKRLQPLLQKHRPSIVIIELGANDGLRGWSLQEAERNLTDMIETSKRYGARVLLVGMRLPPNYGPSYTKQFEELYRVLGKRHKVALVPFMFEGFAEKREMFLSDTVHPNQAAQEQILANIWKRLNPLLRSDSVATRK